MMREKDCSTLGVLVNEEIEVSGSPKPQKDSNETFKLVNDMGTIVVPNDYNPHDAVRKCFVEIRNDCTVIDPQFTSPQFVSQGVPNGGNIFKVELFKAVRKGGVSITRRMYFLMNRKAVCLGVHGIALLGKARIQNLPREVWCGSYMKYVGSRGTKNHIEMPYLYLDGNKSIEIGFCPQGEFILKEDMFFCFTRVK